MSHDIDWEKEIVTIKFNKDSKEKSSSGKTLILATSNGFDWMTIDGKKVGISYNVVMKP
jgi:hypothetical protein